MILLYHKFPAMAEVLQPPRYSVTLKAGQSNSAHFTGMARFLNLA